jgi:hypothetical protein
MNPHNLPPLPPLGQAPAPGSTHTNPGLVDVASQCYPAVLAGADQTQVPGAISSASLVNSNGEEQRPAQLDAIGSNGVSVSASSAPLVSSSGEGGQRLDKRAADTATPTHSGLATEARPDFVSHVVPSLPVIAQTTSPAVTMNADTRSAGGLPQNVMIR